MDSIPLQEDSKAVNPVLTFPPEEIETVGPNQFNSNPNCVSQQLQSENHLHLNSGSGNSSNAAMTRAENHTKSGHVEVHAAVLDADRSEEMTN